MSIVCALSAIGRYILRARRPEERRRDKAKIQLYPIFAKKIPYGAYGVSGRSMPKGNGGYGAGSAVSGDREKAEAGTAAYCRRLGEHPAARRECVTAQAGSPGTAWTRIPWRQAGIFPAYVRKSQPRSGNPPNFITFAGQARPVAAGRGRERKVRATQSTAQANDLISVRV